MSKSETTKTIRQWHNLYSVLIFESILVGVLSGLLAVAFRVIIQKADIFRTAIYSYLKTADAIPVTSWFILLILSGLFLGWLVVKVPLISGSGIPQVKGNIMRQLDMDWPKEIPAKFFGGILTLGLGMSLGREGPSIQLGALTGKAFQKIFKRPQIEEKFLVTCGATAGLSAAFGAPFAGVMFAIEELHKNISPLILGSVLVASTAANYLAVQLLGFDPIFSFKEVTILPHKYYAYIILIGIICGFLGKFFNFSILKVQSLYNKLDGRSKILRPVIPLLLTGIIGFYRTDLLGSGHDLIIHMDKYQTAFTALLILLILKMLFTVVCFGSGVPGGIFLPMLVLGALIGKLSGDIIILYAGLNPIYSLNFMLFGMTAFFTAVVRAPITGSIMITELTGSFTHLLPLITVSVVAYVVTDLIRSEAIYDLLLDNILVKMKKYRQISSKRKSLMEIPVVVGSALEHKLIKDVHWPKNSLLVGIRRGETELIPKGDTEILNGDCLIVLANESDCPDMLLELISMGEEIKE